MAGDGGEPGTAGPGIGQGDQDPDRAQGRDRDHGQDTDRRGRAVVDGVFALLRALRDEGGEANLTTLARRAGLPVATAHRLLQQLTATGAVEQRGRRYAVGATLYELGQAWEPLPGLREAARQPLWDLARTGASVALVVVKDGQVTVLDRADSPAIEPPIDPKAHAADLVKGLSGNRLAAVQGEPHEHLACVAAAVADAEALGMVVVAALLPNDAAVDRLTGPLARIAERIRRKVRPAG